MASESAEKMDSKYVKYSENYPYEDNEALLEKGLIKKSIKQQQLIKQKISA